MESNKNQPDISHMEVREYDSKWGEMYNEESKKIKELLKDKILTIEHIGSTSIPGLASKPIIDMAVVISSWKDTNILIEPLATLGYFPDVFPIDESNAGERCLLRKGSPTQFHLSIAYNNRGSFLERQILFRDYIREHNEDRNAYAQLKKDLLLKDPTGKDTYINNKTDFVMKTLKKAGFINKWFDLSKY